MAKRKTSLLYDGSHYKVNLPVNIVRERGWEKGEALWIDDDNGHIIITKVRSKKTQPTIYSIGYEGKTIEEFTKSLKEYGVEQLIDIRENPFSYKKGFSKNPLKIALNESGITYQHIKELGTDRKSRKEYKNTGDLNKLCEIFKERLNNNLDRYELLKALINYKQSAIMCFEDDYQMCHRQVIEKRLEKDGFRVLHICNGKT
jgi:uncharacterized protein (DUF488 family)